jgi:hypothetical protein
VHRTRKKYRRLQNTVQRAALSTVLFTKLCRAGQSRRMILPERVESVGDEINA